MNNTLLSFFILLFGIASNVGALDCQERPLWQSDEVYVGGTQVQYNNRAYTANYWTQNNNPETHSDNPWDHWRNEGDCDGSGGPANQSPSAQANGPYTAFVGEDVIFSSDGSADADGSIVSFLWDFGDGNISAQANPTHVYQQPGNYTATLSVMDDQGASSQAAASVRIDQVVSTPGDGCGSLPQYAAGTSYNAGDRVFNLRDVDGQRVEYVCVIAGWCSLNAPFYYEPGNGTAWDDAWDEVGLCADQESQPPAAEANGPYAAQVGRAIGFSSAGSSDSDGNIVVYAWDFGDGTSSDIRSPTHAYDSPGRFTATLTVTDNEGLSDSDTAVVTISEPGSGNPGELPARIINGYWHNFDNDSVVMRLGEVSPAFDVINVAFAEPTTPTSGVMEFILDPLFDEAEFRRDLQTLQQQGRKVLISIGGANGQVQLNTVSARDNFVSTMIAIVEDYGFDGIDIDFEGHSLSFEFGDDDFRNPTTPVIVNTIEAIQRICNHFGPDFMLTMAPETFFVQLGYYNYGGISSGADRRAGAYLPLIHALRDKLTFLQVQNYNSGPITGLDNQFHFMGGADFHVAMIDMLLKGFPITGDESKFFPPLREDQILLGLPAYVLAGNGFTPTGEVHKALDCLIKATNCDGIYDPGAAYPQLRGLMTWSINWDRFGDFGFSVPHRAYLDALP